MNNYSPLRTWMLAILIPDIYDLDSKNTISPALGLNRNNIFFKKTSQEENESLKSPLQTLITSQ